MSDSPSGGLFDQIVAASGLSGVFASKAIARALTRAGVEPTSMNRGDLRRALPDIEHALRIYLDAGELGKRMAAIQRLA